MTALPQHDYVGGVCTICGDRVADNVNRDRICIRKVNPGSHPSSMFTTAEGFEEIGRRYRELAAERTAQLAATEEQTENS